MVTTVNEHYTRHLGPIYTWTVGDLGAAFARSEAELAAVLPASKPAGTAVDLGAGFGLHAIPLARRGYSVVAIDGYEPLLRELTLHAGSLPIRTVNADLADFRAFLSAPVDVIVCMGDTLTHLPHHSAVAALLENVAASLNPGGLFVTTFRDYESAPPQGDARFILVRSDEHRILTCFLEYGETTVTVHDLLHQREGMSWRLRVSSYPKLRLPPQRIIDQLRSLGLSVLCDSLPGGMIRIGGRLL